MFVALLGAMSMASEEPAKGLAGAAVTRDAWECRQVRPRRLDRGFDSARSALRAAATLPDCRRLRRIELCEPVRTGWPDRPSIASPRNTAPLRPRICAVLRCDERPSGYAAPIALEDAFGRRAVTPRVIDRICVSVDE
jgi:hypothetical protein